MDVAENSLKVVFIVSVAVHNANDGKYVLLKGVRGNDL